MDVVNTIVQNDYINKVTIIRNGSCQKIQCSKTFTDYFAVESRKPKGGY
jgi:hypothetical protein